MTTGDIGYTHVAPAAGPRRDVTLLGLVDVLLPLALLAVLAAAPFTPPFRGSAVGVSALAAAAWVLPALAVAGAYAPSWRRSSAARRFGALLAVAVPAGAVAYAGAAVTGAVVSVAEAATMAAVLPLGWMAARAALPARSADGSVATRWDELAGEGASAEERGPSAEDAHERAYRAVTSGACVHVESADLGPDLARLHRVDVGDVIPLGGARHAGAMFAVKRTVDVVGAGVLLVVCAPVWGAAALAVLVVDGGPVLFRQERVGLRGRRFTMWKLRTMRVVPDEVGAAGVANRADVTGGGFAVDDIGAAVAEIKTASTARVTALGRVLRASSIDELPQLVNVLRGEMSLVGPRPLRPFEASSLTPLQRLRHEVRPGITGPWQVLGRSDISWDERMLLDCSYATTWSITYDLRVLLRTVPAALSRRGAV